MIVFFVQSLFYMGMTLSIFAAFKNKLLIAVVSMLFIVNQLTMLLYGIVTAQLGFILIVVFQFFLILLTYIYLSNNIDGEYLDEDK